MIIVLPTWIVHTFAWIGVIAFLAVLLSIFLLFYVVSKALINMPDDF